MSTPGLDLLALPMQDVDMLARAWPNGFALGCLYGTFGDIFKPMARILDTGKCPLVRIHLINWPCVRGHNCEPGEPDHNTQRHTIGQRSIAVQKFADKYPKVRFYVSPLLEYDERLRINVHAWVNAIHKYCPIAIPVISPSSKGVTIPHALIEHHGNAAHGDIVSNDGESFFDVGGHWKNRGRIITFAWWHECNLRKNGAPFVPPSKRSPHNRVTLNQIHTVIKLIG